MPPAHSADVQISSVTLQSIRNDMDDMRVSMSKMADALTKIAVLEEKYQVTSSTMLKIMEKQEKLDKDFQDIRMGQLEQLANIKSLLQEYRTHNDTEIRKLEEKTEDEIQAIRDQMLKQSTTIDVALRAVKVAWSVLGVGVVYGIWQFIKFLAKN